MQRFPSSWLGPQPSHAVRLQARADNLADTTHGKTAGLLERAADAGVQLPATDRPGPSDQPLPMQLSPDIGELLGIGPPRRSRAAAQGGDFLASQDGMAVDRATVDAAMHDAQALLDDRLAVVRRWLALGETRERLLEWGSTPERVEKALARQVATLQRQLADEAARSKAVFPLVPTAHRLFTDAVLATAPDGTEDDTAHTTAASTATASAASSTATVSFDVAAAQAEIDALEASLRRFTVYLPPAETPPSVSSPGIDLEKRAGAIASLEAFEFNLLESLPQLKSTRGDTVGQLSSGKVFFRSEDDLAMAFPCMTGRNFWGTPQYPSPGPGQKLQEALVGREDLQVERVPGQNLVRVLPRSSTIWKTTRFYTDDAVEAAKLAMWHRILTYARKQYYKVRWDDRWMKW